MCGIAGIIDRKRSASENEDTLRRMLATQHHRGPDATGLWSRERVFLGHNRLSIIDLSEAANQPMHYRNFTLVYNGELYNYIELRKKLEGLGHKFVTDSDSEVILHAFDEWHYNCVFQFVGMWAFVIWDELTNEIYASRDRFGIKPFYYILEDNRFYFASEIKALKHAPVFSNEINQMQVSRGLQMGWLGYFDETYYTKVKALPAAHNLLFSDIRFATYRYWDMDPGKYTDMNFEEKCDHFYDLFADSIRIHLRSDVPVASCLSGGLDSSAIVSMVQEMNPGMKYKTFSIFYEGDGDVDERPFIREVVEKFPTIEPHYFSPADAQVEESFHHALYHADLPVTGSSFVSQYFLMKMIGEQGIKVVLDGQGADEYLGGYMHSFYRYIAGKIREKEFGKALKITRDINKRLGQGGGAMFSHMGKSLLSSLQREHSLYSLEYERYYPFMLREKPKKVPFNLKQVRGTKLDAFSYHLVATTSLPSLLHYEDRNSMAFSVESRVPFLDHRLVEFCFKLRDDDRINGTDTKYIMRESLKRILPPAIYARKDKKGFVTPGENKWLRGPLKFLLENRHHLPDFIDQEKAGRIFDAYLKGDNSKATLVWRLATLGEWAK
jgi:asparagine synthase (glutamine-hydrolysing)